MIHRSYIQWLSHYADWAIPTPIYLSVCLSVRPLVFISIFVITYTPLFIYPINSGTRHFTWLSSLLSSLLCFVPHFISTLAYHFRLTQLCFPGWSKWSSWSGSRPELKYWGTWWRWREILFVSLTLCKQPRGAVAGNTLHMHVPPYYFPICNSNLSWYRGLQAACFSCPQETW